MGQKSLFDGLTGTADGVAAEVAGVIRVSLFFYFHGRPVLRYFQAASVHLAARIPLTFTSRFKRQIEIRKMHLRTYRVHCMFRSRTCLLPGRKINAESQYSVLLCVAVQKLWKISGVLQTGFQVAALRKRPYRNVGSMGLGLRISTTGGRP